MHRFRHKKKPAKTTGNKSKKTGHTEEPSTQHQQDGTPLPPEIEHMRSSEDAKTLKRLKRLQRDGIVILIDQANLEITRREYMKELNEKASEGISYAQLVDIIARSGHMSQTRRKVLATYLVVSKQTQAVAGFKPSSRYRDEHDIELLRSPDERVFHRGKRQARKGGGECSCHAQMVNNKCECKLKKRRKEKGVDCMLVRAMTQEFAGIEVLRLQGIAPPDRTFCLVAGDFDYVDVVQQAREVGCNVEIWFWVGAMGFSKEWKKQRGREGCKSPRCGNLTIKDLRRFRKTLGRRPKKTDDRWSEASDRLDSGGRFNDSGGRFNDSGGRFIDRGEKW